MRKLEIEQRRFSPGDQEKAWIEDVRKLRFERIRTIEDRIRYDADFGMGPAEKLQESKGPKPKCIG